MTKEVAELLTKYQGEIYENYSGRGMFGRETTGITYEHKQEFYDSIADVMEEGDQEELEQVGEFLRNVKFDNMGLGVIVY